MTVTPVINDSLKGVRARLVAVVILLFPAATLLVDRAATFALLLLALLGVIFTLSDRRVLVPLSRDEKLLLFSVVFLVAVALLSYLLGDLNYLGFKKIGRYLRFLLLVPVYLVVRRLSDGEGVWWHGLAFGAIAAGLSSIFVVAVAELPFAAVFHGLTEPLLFGYLSLAAAFMCLGGLDYFRRHANWMMVIPLAGFVLGCIAAVISGVRGAWLALPVLALISFWFLAREPNPRARWVMLGGLAALIGIAYLIPATGVAARIDDLLVDVERLLKGQQSIGMFSYRIELAQVALDAFSRNPLFGTGVGGFAQVLREWVEAGLVPEDLLVFSHPHNEYLLVLADRGLAGLAALLMVFGIPAAHFAWGLRHADRNIAGLSFAGLMLVASFAHFALTEAIFDRTMPITFYVFCLAVIYGLVRANERQFLARDFKREHSLSVIIITLNEADRIRPCLESVHGWADEIIVLDSGSTDGTVDILREYTDKVWVTDWPGFGKQKQRALDHATCDWVLSVDADERVTPELRAEIDHTLRGRPEHTGYDVHRPVVLFGQIMDFSGSGQSPLRLFERKCGSFTQVPVHERIELSSGTLGRLRGALYHETYRDYYHAVAKFGEYAWLQANARYEKGKRSGLFSASLRGVLNFIYNYFVRLGFLDGGRGFILAALHANYTFNKYAALWEIEVRQAHLERDAARKVTKGRGKRD